MTIDQLIAHCERQRDRLDKSGAWACDHGEIEKACLADGKILVYDEVIDKLKLIKEFDK